MHISVTLLNSNY